MRAAVLLPGIVFLAAGCGSRESRSISIAVTFATEAGTPFTDATITTSDGVEIRDVATTDPSGFAIVSAQRGDVLTGFHESRRVSTLVGSDEDIDLVSFRDTYTLNTPFRVVGLTPGDPVEVDAVTTGTANSAGEFAGTAVGKNESDGEILLVAYDAFNNTTKWGAAGNAPVDSVIVLSLSTSFSIEPSVSVDVRNVPGPSFVTLRGLLDGAELFSPHSSAVITTDALVAFRVMGRDIANSLYVSGGGGPNGFVASRTEPWPSVGTIELILSPPTFSISDAVQPISSFPLTLTMNGDGADAIYGSMIYGDDRWDFVYPLHLLSSHSLDLPRSPFEESLPQGAPHGKVRLIDVASWEPGSPPFDVVAQHRSVPDSAVCVDFTLEGGADDELGMCR